MQSRSNRATVRLSQRLLGQLLKDVLAPALGEIGMSPSDLYPVSFPSEDQGLTIGVDVSRIEAMILTAMPNDEQGVKTDLLEYGLSETNIDQRMTRVIRRLRQRGMVRKDRDDETMFIPTEYGMKLIEAIEVMQADEQDDLDDVEDAELS